MRHRRHSPAARAALFVFRVARRGVLLAVLPALLVLAVYLCFASTPAP
ncbi:MULTISPECIES: hypothetical protein [Streptomyces]|nr:MULTISPECIES: hypothetical protein [Streptomyces]